MTMAIFCYRQLSDQFFGPLTIDPTISFISFLALTVGNVPLTISLILLNFWVSRKLSKINLLSRHAITRVVVEFVYLVAVAGMSSLIVNMSILWNEGIKAVYERPVFLEQFLSVLTFDTAIYYITNVFLYFRSIHTAELREQINKRNRVNYQYSLLKQQLNPHFLFNSLNVLDHLVKTDPERASGFINKLADIYRYQLNQERKESVPLSVELKFVESYANLLKERFGDAISLNVVVEPEQIDNFRIIPCALQLLVENAVKHNVVSDAVPLEIVIRVTENDIVTSNNINPKFTKSESWGIGLQSIREQYKTIFNEQIEIVQKQNVFSVRLPLIEI